MPTLPLREGRNFSSLAKKNFGEGTCRKPFPSPNVLARFCALRHSTIPQGEGRDGYIFIIRMRFPPRIDSLSASLIHFALTMVSTMSGQLNGMSVP